MQCCYAGLPHISPVRAPARRRGLGRRPPARPGSPLRVAGLGSTDAILIADDNQAIKKGSKSEGVGVAYQNCGLTNQIEDCLVVPMQTYATAAGHAFIDRAFNLPRSGPRTGPLPSRWHPAVSGLRDETSPGATPAGSRDHPGVPCGWFALDSGHGRDDGLRAFCHDHTSISVLAVPMDLPLLDARGHASCCRGHSD